MTKIGFGGHPYLLGFEQLERLVERTAKTASEGYPPFNIEATSENTYRITLAVAGFGEQDIAIEVNLGTGGSHAATVWTCDLSAEYVKINAEYRT